MPDARVRGKACGEAVALPIDPSHLSLFVAFLSLVVSIKVAYDVGRIAGRLSDRELARMAVEELRAQTREG